MTEKLKAILATASDPMWLVIDYTNWRGERAKRIIKPISISFGSTPWHPDPQWQMFAIDIEKGADRYFALSGIHGASPAVQARQVR